MDGNHLRRIDVVLVDHDASGQVADGHDTVCGKHPPGLDVQDTGVDVLLVPPVVGCGMDMDHQWLAGQLLGGNSGKVCKPVVGVDDIEFVLVLHGYRSADHCVTGNLLHEVGAILAGELVLHSVLDPEILALPPALLFHDGREFLRADIRYHVRTDVDKLHLIQKLIYSRRGRVHGNIAGVDDCRGALILVTGGGRHHEQSLDSVVGEAFDYSFTGSTQTTCDMRRELPPEHQYPHLFFFIKLLITRRAAVLSADDIAP